MYLWRYYCELKKGQQITYTELKAWSELTAKPLAAWEVETLMRIESVVTQEARDE